MKTITGKNQKARLVQTAHNMIVYSLDNYFIGEDIPDDRARRIIEKSLEQYAGYPRMGKIKLDGQAKNGDFKYRLRIHSNLWYEFEGSHEKE